MPEPVGPETAHERIVRTVRHRIESGEWPAGSPVPSEAALGRESRWPGTVKAALQALQVANLIVVVAAKGRYVAGAENATAVPAHKARRIAAELRAEIESGVHIPGSKFLSEAALSQRFGASRYTAEAGARRAVISRLDPGRSRERTFRA